MQGSNRRVTVIEPDPIGSQLDYDIGGDYAGANERLHERPRAV
jgi:hypothetical protein